MSDLDSEKLWGGMVLAVPTSDRLADDQRY